MSREKVIDDAAEAARKVALALGDEGVRILVDGAVVQTLPLPLYEALQQKLAADPETNAFLLETPAGDAALRLRLPPPEELGGQPLDLHTEDGVHYGRHYRLEIVEADEGRKRLAVILDAQSGAEVARMPWHEFAQRVKDDVVRSATPYRHMLGEYDPTLHLMITARRYRPPAREERSGEPEAETIEEVPDKHRSKARAWLNRHPMLAIGACALCGVVAVAGVLHATLDRGPVFRRQKVDYTGPVDTDKLLSRYEAIVRSFEILAVEDQEAARESLNEIGRGLPRISGNPLTPEQRERVAKLGEELPKLEKLLWKATWR